MYKILSILIFSLSFAQWFSIEHDGVNRTYYVSYPTAIDSAPLIINMHGYGGNASGQITYTQMNQYAHDQGMAVVYPQGLNNSWNVYTSWDSNNYDDVGFISTMIDAIANDFNIDLDRVYACGMSNGGYMTYRLACDLADKIAAFGSVTGNFMLTNSIGDCTEQNRDIPIIHFHGTSDGIVQYYPPAFDGSLTVGESIEFWSNHNDFIDESVESINSNVEKYTYYNDSSLAKFIHYKIYGGGHEWFSDFWGFNTSEELVSFFSGFKLSDFINNQLLGDINEDDYINIQDVILLINMILNQEYELMGDLNEDGNINVLDVIQLVNIILS